MKNNKKITMLKVLFSVLIVASSNLYGKSPKPAKNTLDKNYNKFWYLNIPTRVTELKTANISNHKEISLTFKIKPTNFREFYYSYGSKYLGFFFKYVFTHEYRDGLEDFDENSCTAKYVQFGAAYQIFKNYGDKYKKTIAIGALLNFVKSEIDAIEEYRRFATLTSQNNYNYDEYEDDEGFYDFKRSTSLFLAGTVSLPKYYSYVTLYGDFQQVGLGINSYPFYISNEDDFFTNIEFIKIFDKDFKNYRYEGFFAQPTIGFKLNKKIQLSVSFKTNDTLMLKFNYMWYLKPKWKQFDE